MWRDEKLIFIVISNIAVVVFSACARKRIKIETDLSLFESKGGREMKTRTNAERREEERRWREIQLVRSRLKRSQAQWRINKRNKSLNKTGPLSSRCVSRDFLRRFFEKNCPHTGSNLLEMSN